LLLPRRALPPALLLWSLVTVAMFVHHTDPAYKLTADGHLSLPLFASPLALEFMAGCLVGLAVKRGVSTLAGLSLGLGLGLLLLVGGYIGQHFPQEAHYGLTRAGIFGGAAALIVYGAAGLERSGWLYVPRWLVFWGDASYSTYLTHMYVLWVVAAVWPATVAARSSAPPDSVDAWLRTASAIAVCGCVAAACHVAVERPLHRLLVRRLALSTASGRGADGGA
ncbi:MAG TPA: acyltransferase family protein, partial [Lacipirellula sp.]